MYYLDEINRLSEINSNNQSVIEAIPNVDSSNVVEMGKLMDLYSSTISVESSIKVKQPKYNLFDTTDYSIPMLASFNFYKCLKNVIINANYNGSMKLLIEIMEAPDPTIKKVFDVKSTDSMQLDFVDIRTTNGQCKIFY